jgi:hypothetical protein
MPRPPILVHLALNLVRQVLLVVLNQVPQRVVRVFQIVVHDPVAGKSPVWMMTAGCSGPVAFSTPFAITTSYLPAPDYDAVIGRVAEVLVHDCVARDCWVGDYEAEQRRQAYGEGAQGRERGTVVKVLCQARSGLYR